MSEFVNILEQVKRKISIHGKEKLAYKVMTEKATIDEFVTFLYNHNDAYFLSKNDPYETKDVWSEASGIALSKNLKWLHYEIPDFYRIKLKKTKHIKDDIGTTIVYETSKFVVIDFPEEGQEPLIVIDKKINE